MSKKRPQKQTIQKTTQNDSDALSGERLQKVLARSGVGSRRGIEREVAGVLDRPDLVDVPVGREHDFHAGPQVVVVERVASSTGVELLEEVPRPGLVDRPVHLGDVAGERMLA